MNPKKTITQHNDETNSNPKKNNKMMKMHYIFLFDKYNT
jgi:hypothetical protein